MSEWRVGKTLITRNTRGWSEERLKDNDFHESHFVFKDFNNHDEGRSRKLICKAETPEIAREIVNLKAQVEMLEDAIGTIRHYSYGEKAQGVSIKTQEKLKQMRGSE